MDLQTDAVLSWPDEGDGRGGPEAEVHVAMRSAEHQSLVLTGERGELELRGSAFSAQQRDSELWISDGRGTERVVVPAADVYRTMVEEVSSVLRGDPGWVLPLPESRDLAAVLDATRASAAAGGSAVAV